MASIVAVPRHLTADLESGACSLRLDTSGRAFVVRPSGELLLELQSSTCRVPRVLPGAAPALTCVPLVLQTFL